MVAGIDRFRDHFRGGEAAFVLIGGAACEAWMSSLSLPFRRTKDLDIVLIIEMVDADFAERFWDFVEAGQYETRQRATNGRREFFRFLKPEAAGYPHMLEVFTRAPTNVRLFTDQTVVPVPMDDAGVSLSAVLMEDSYYELVLATRYDSDGVPMVGAAGLVPLKTRAWLDMRARKAAGGRVDESDIKKHRNDVFRLALTLPATPGPDLSDVIKSHLRRFVDAFPEDAEAWPAILRALKETIQKLPPPSVLLETLKVYFRLT